MTIVSSLTQAHQSVPGFEQTFVHSILFPLSPFIISRINHDNNENVSSTMEATTSSPFGGKSSVETSRETGILVALYAVGLLGIFEIQRRLFIAG